MIIADTDAVLALLDTAHPAHEILLPLWERDPAAWLLPWAILPEVDYLARRILGERVARLFLGDVASGAFAVEGLERADLVRAVELDTQYSDLRAGLVDCVVCAVSERIRPAAIATLDERDFSVLVPEMRLYPRDLRP